MDDGPERGRFFCELRRQGYDASCPIPTPSLSREIRNDCRELATEAANRPTW